MEWFYDLRGLDLAAWRAGSIADLTAHRAAGETVVLLIGQLPADAAGALTAHLVGFGFQVRTVTLTGLPAIELAAPAPSGGDSQDAAAEPAVPEAPSSGPARAASTGDRPERT